MLFNKNYFVIILSLLFLFACNNNGESLYIDPTSESEEVVGTVEVNIPVISSLVSDQLTRAKKTINNRALLAIDVIAYEIYDENGLFESGVLSTIGQGVEYYTILEVAPGSYTMSVDIYNTDVSSDVPVVSGVSGSFTVESGGLTPVFITPIPNAPIEVDSEDSLTLNNSGFVATLADEQLEMGSEKWFKYTALYDNTTLELNTIDGDFNTGYFFFVYDENGIPVNSLATIFNDEVLTLSGSAGDIYYIGVIYADLSGGIDTIELTSVTLNSNELVIEDNDNTFNTATALTTDGMYVSGLIHENDSDFYSINVTDGVMYTIDKNSDADLNVVIYNSNFDIVNSFTMYNDTMKLFHYESDVIYIEISDSTEGLNSYYFSITETLFETVSISTSNMWQEFDVVYGEVVYYELPVTAGATYSLAWDSSWQGTGIYSADVMVSVFDFYGNTYVTEQDSGYYYPHLFTIPENVTSVIISIDGVYLGGDLGVLLQEEVPEVIIIE